MQGPGTAEEIAAYRAQHNQGPYIITNSIDLPGLIAEGTWTQTVLMV